MPAKQRSLASQGYSRAFTAEAVARWRALIPATEAVTVDRLLTTDPDLAYVIRRAAGTDASQFRSPGRPARSGSATDRRRVARWLEWFARDRAPLPTKNGRDNAWVVVVPGTNDRPAWRLLAHEPTEVDLTALTAHEQTLLDEAAQRALVEKGSFKAALAAADPAHLAAHPVFGRGTLVLADPVLDPTFDPDYDPIPGQPDAPLAPGLDPSITRPLVPEGVYDDDNSDLTPCDPRTGEPYPEADVAA